MCKEMRFPPKPCVLIDVVFEIGDMDIDEVVFARLQGLLDSARAVKMTTR